MTNYKEKQVTENGIEYTVRVYPNGTKYWHDWNGEVHRIGAPAYEGWDGSKGWYKNGNSHREDGPAVEFADGSKTWWLNGELHRTDGPAVENADGNKEWWLNNEPFETESEWKKEVDKLNNMKTYQITPPEGYRAIERIEGDIKIITFEKIEPKKINLKKLKNKIGEYREEKGHRFFFNIYGEKAKSNCFVFYNNNTEEEIEAQELNLIFKGLVEMYSNVLDWNNRLQQKWFLGYDTISGKIGYFCAILDKRQGTTYASSEDVLVQIVSEMGEENVLKMLKNLR